MNEPREREAEQPPLLGSWRNLYLLLILLLAGESLLFWLLTRWAS